MRKISVWARHHAWPARFIIISGIGLLNIIGIFAGNVLTDLGLVMPAAVLLASLLFICIAFFYYPAKNNKDQYRNFYRSQKTADLVLLSATFILVVAGTTRLNAKADMHTNGLYAATATVPVATTPVIPVEAVPTPTAPATDNTTITENENLPAQPSLSKKGLRKQLTKQVKEIRKLYKSSSDGEKVALIILSVLVALGLLYLLAALSCSISCSGSDAAAILVGVLGTALIVFLFVRVVQRITRGPRKERTDKKTEESGT